METNPVERRNPGWTRLIRAQRSVPAAPETAPAPETSRAVRLRLDRGVAPAL